MLLLACVIPVALLGSFSCLFVAGAANLVGFHSAWRGSWRERLAFVLVALVTLFTAALVMWIGQNQLASATGSSGLDTREGMDRYWAKGFPPDSLLLWPWWLLMGLTGQMVAYPLGAERGGSILTAAMVATPAAAVARFDPVEVVSRQGVTIRFASGAVMEIPEDREDLVKAVVLALATEAAPC